MRNQTSFRLTTTLLPTDTTAKTTTVINKVDSNGDKFYPSFTEETVVLTNDDRTVMETTRATCNNGVLTFVKRGLSDDNSATEIANRKLTWNPGTLAFITAGASDYIDIDDDLTWTGKQTYTGDMTSNGKATYNGLLETKKGVKYPNFDDLTALQAYGSPFAGMFATVDDTGELYRYNAVTCCWDMVTTAEVNQYIFREDEDFPAEGTADNIVTFVDDAGKKSLYKGTEPVANMNYYVDALVVGGGGGASQLPSEGYGCNTGGGGGAGGGFNECLHYIIGPVECVEVGAGGIAHCDGCQSSFAGIISLGGGHGIRGGDCNIQYVANGGGAGKTGISAGIGLTGYNGGGSSWSEAGGGGAGAGGGGGGPSQNAVGGSGGKGKYSFITGQNYAGGGGGFGYYSGCASCSRTGSPGLGQDNCGGGGAATWNGDQYTCGKSGVVVLRYPTDGSYGIHCATGGCVTCSDGYTIHTFTQSGEFCIVN